MQRRGAPRDTAKVLCAATGTQCSQVSEQADRHWKTIRGEDSGRRPGKETISHGLGAFGKNETLRALAPSSPLYSKPSSLLSRVAASPSHSPLPKQATCALTPLRHFVPWLRGALLALRRPSAPISPGTHSVQPCQRQSVPPLSSHRPRGSRLAGLSGVHTACLFTSVSLGEWKLHPILLVSAVPTRGQDTAFTCVLQTSLVVTHRKKRILYHDLLYTSITHIHTELKQKFHGTKFTMMECHTL